MRPLIAPVEAKLRAIFGDLIYGADIKDLAQAAGNLLLEHQVILATARELHRGHDRRPAHRPAGDFRGFKGGVVCYTNEVKHNALGVPTELLERSGAVSPEVCAALAQGPGRSWGADLGLQRHRCGGPDPDDRGNPVGASSMWAWPTLIGPGCAPLHLSYSRGRNRNMACHHGFDMVRRYLTGLEIE